MNHAQSKAAFCICCLLIQSPILAIPMASVVDDPVPSESNVFAAQPALISTQKFSLGATLSHSLSEQKLSEADDTQERKTTLTERHIRKSLGLSIPVGGSLGISGAAKYINYNHPGKNRTP